MDLLTDLLIRFPNCKVTINSSKPRKKAKEGDIKLKRGEKYIRQQVLTRDGYHVRNGRPVFEWVKWEESRKFPIPTYLPFF